MASYPLLLLSFSTIFLLSTVATAGITIPLSPSTTALPSSSATSLHQILSHLASTSVARALRLKSLSPLTTSLAAVKSPLFPRSYGGYSISLSFGTPPQTTKFVMDTGSSLVWFPCTPRYFCSRCNFPNVDPTRIPTFLPKNSDTAAVLDCLDPKCKWIFGNDVVSQCPVCPNCTQTACPPYFIQYGSGSTSGVLLTEKLDFPDKTVSDFLVGCSINSAGMPEGIAGFGRGNDSLPSQIGAKRFSYCMVSHGFDDAPVSSDLVLDLDSRKKKTPEVSYTPFEQNPNSSNSAFQTYYYVPLRQILVEGNHVEVPYKYLEPSRSPARNGGTIVDSGTTFTYMERPVYDAVVDQIMIRMSNYTEAKVVEDLTGLAPCFNVSDGGDTAVVPELSFKFKGGAEMKLPATNYFVLADDGVVCLTIVSDDVGAGGVDHVGPAIVLGNYQQRDYYIEYDLEAERFGFKQQICTA